MTDNADSYEDPRRRLLLGMLVSGIFTVGFSPLSPRVVQAAVLGDIPGRLPANRSIYRLEGTVRVNGQPASMDTLIHAGDTVDTGDRSQVIFVVGEDAFILRSNGSLHLTPAENVSQRLRNTSIGVMRLLSGKLLSVFGKRSHRITTAVATIGIRGTGLYVESDPEESYVCTCYGTTEISALDESASTETIVATHHNNPRYISAKGRAGQLIRPAPFKNHDDEELLLIETLVGRSTPFSVPGGLRSRSRRY